MARHLVLHVRLHDRFHGVAFGVPEWPPAPARLFQALVAAAARGRSIRSEAQHALVWLEGLAPPRVGAPPSKLGTEQTLWVPNNDLDAKGGDPANVASIRTQKVLQPRFVKSDTPLLFVWSWEGDADHAGEIVRVADDIYQFGRGIDLAWARGEVLDDEGLERLLARYPGTVFLPDDTGSARGGTLCPVPGSLESLRRRFEARRIHEIGDGRKRREVFENVPKPVFRPVHYRRRRTIHVYDLVDARDGVKPFAASLRRAAKLIEAVRDAAAARLRAAFPEHAAEIERVLIGRKVDGRDGGPIQDRIRLVPLPSIGHEHADLGVRRIAVELPAGASIPIEDLTWAFDGLEPADVETGEVALYVLVRADDTSMLRRYADAGRRFRSVTPAALPEVARRRRIEPSRRAEEAKGGAERLEEERRARDAVRAALRHAGVLVEPASIHVQREPFDARGDRAEAFAPGTRFAKERLWHVEVELVRPFEGPLVIGDGRFLGLGVMAPRRSVPGVHAFAVEEGLVVGTDPLDVTGALRRAVMALAQEIIGQAGRLPTFFSGHADDGKPARDGHLAFVFDAERARLLVIAPHVLDRRAPRADEHRELSRLEQALARLEELRAGRAGLLSLRRTSIDPDVDPIFTPARTWRTAVPYLVARHAKKVGAAEVVASDVHGECRRRGLPEPRVAPRSVRGVAGAGVVSEVELTFARAVPGPILLGRSRHLGGGLFVAVDGAVEHAGRPC